MLQVVELGLAKAMQNISMNISMLNTPVICTNVQATKNIQDRLISIEYLGKYDWNLFLSKQQAILPAV